MKNLTATFCLSLAILLGSVTLSWSAEPIAGYCLSGTKHSHLPITSKCSSAYERGNYQTAFGEFQLLAKRGDANAQFNIGQMYLRGHGVPQDLQIAIKWYTLAAKQGNAGAAYNLGVMYRTGKGVLKDTKSALKWYNAAAKLGDLDSVFTLGLMYQKGDGVLQDYKEAVRWFRLGAEKEHTSSLYNLGKSHFFGQGVQRDLVYSHMWFAIAATSGDKAAIQAQDITEQKMTPAQIAKAKKLARECIRKKYKGC